MPRVNIPQDQYFDRNGNPLDGGKLYSRETDGTTAKPLYPTQADLEAGTNALANPVVLDSEGRPPNMFGSGDFWFNLTDKNDVQIPEWPKSPVEIGNNVNSPNLFSGLRISNNSTDADHDIDIATGSMVDSTGNTRMNLNSALTKQIDATWVAGDDAGGMASGATLAASSWYHMFLVLVNDAVDVMFDTSITCANGVANNAVTAYGYINSVRTNTSTNIEKFKNLGNHVWYDEMKVGVNQSNPGSSAVLVEFKLPSDIETIGKFAIKAEQGASGMGDILVRTPGGTDQAPDTLSCDIRGDTSTNESLNKDVITDTSSQIEYRCSTGTDGTLVICALGWEIIR